MATTTVRLDAEEEQMLKELAPYFGGKSSVLRQALRRLADESKNQALLSQFVDDWNATAGTPSEEEVTAMIERFDH